MEAMNTNNGMKTSQKLRVTWHRESDYCADLMLEPGIGLAQLQTAIDAGRVFVDEDGDWGEKGFLYCFADNASCSEIILARIVTLDRDSVDDSGSFVLSQDTENLSRDNGILTEQLANELEQRLKVVSDLMERQRPKEEAMFRAGKAVDSYVKGRPYPTNHHLEGAVWATQLRGKIGRDDFRDVCDNLRRGWSAIGDC